MLRPPLALLPAPGLVFTHTEFTNCFAQGICLSLQTETRVFLSQGKLFSVNIKPADILSVFLSQSVQTNVCLLSVSVTSQPPVGNTNFHCQNANQVFRLNKHIFILLSYDKINYSEGFCICFCLVFSIS